MYNENEEVGRFRLKTENAKENLKSSDIML